MASLPDDVVRALDLQFGDPKFKSCYDRQLDLFSVVPSSAMLVNSQLVCLCPVGIHPAVEFNMNYLFQEFARPHLHQCYKYCRG